MRSSVLNSFGCAVVIHVTLIGLALFTAEEKPKPAPKLIVQTVVLQPAHKKQSPTIRAPQYTAPPKQEPHISKPIKEKEPAPAETHNESPQPLIEKPKESAKQEAPAKTAIQQEQPTSQQKPSSKTKTAPTKNAPPSKAKQPAAKASSTGKVTATQSQKPIYNQQLVTEALSRLNNMKASSSSTKSSTISSSIPTTAPIGALHSESASYAGDMDGEDAPLEGSREAMYIHDFIRRIQLHMQLPEAGSAKVRLVVQRSGHVASVEILTCKNTAIRKTIEAQLPSIVFSAFGASFPQESSHTFIVKLSNDFMWSCT